MGGFVPVAHLGVAKPCRIRQGGNETWPSLGLRGRGVSASLVRSSLDGVNDQSGGLGDARGEWYFCFKHNKVEMRHECKRVDRMGPYPTPEDAENWRARVAARNASWEAQEKDE